MHMPLKKILVTLVVALLAAVPLSSSADTGGCLLNGVPVPGDPERIEGTRRADVIDCRLSSARHDIYADNGADTIYGSEYDDFIAGGGKGDWIDGRGGDDAIDGGASGDTIYGGPGNDTIFGGVGSSPAAGVGCVLQTAPAGSSSDGTQNALLLRAAGPLRRLPKKGGSGDDTIYGGVGHDCIDAGSGEDTVYGGDGNDTIEGGNHSDQLDGGLGDDWLDGGMHTDTCIGGGGTDLFFDCER